MRARPEQTRTLANALPSRQTDTGAADIVDRVMSYIATSSADVTMAAAAAMVGMSESKFSRYLTRTAGQTFSETVPKMRMAQACQLLSTTDLPVTGIAHRVGYRNLSNFNRQFQRSYQQTPTAYRRQARTAASISRRT